MPIPSLRAGSSSGFGGADTCCVKKFICWCFLLFYDIIMMISYQLLTWSPTRSFFKTSCGTLQPHPFNLVKLVNLKISIFENPSQLVSRGFTLYSECPSVCVCVSVCAHLWHPSPFVSTIWCSRPYKSYIFWKLIIWWWQWPRRRLTKRQRQIQSASKTQCMLYLSKAGGSRI